MMDENRGKPMRHLAKDLQLSEGTIRNVVHQDLGEKTCVLRRGQQFIWTKITQENRLNGPKRFLKKLKHPERQKCPWFFSDEKYFHQDQEVNTKNDTWWLCAGGPQ
ncbi:hypothetical protein ACTXT7_000551 [Hymenolepis weldensis]